MFHLNITIMHCIGGWLELQWKRIHLFCLFSSFEHLCTTSARSAWKRYLFFTFLSFFSGALLVLAIAVIVQLHLSRGETPSFQGVRVWAVEDPCSSLILQDSSSSVVLLNIQRGLGTVTTTAWNGNRFNRSQAAARPDTFSLTHLWEKHIQGWALWWRYCWGGNVAYSPVQYANGSSSYFKRILYMDQNSLMTTYCVSTEVRNMQLFIDVLVFFYSFTMF